MMYIPDLTEEEIKAMIGVQFVFVYRTGEVKVGVVVQAELGIGLTAVWIKELGKNLICVNQIKHGDMHPDELMQIICKAIRTGTYLSNLDIPDSMYTLWGIEREDCSGISDCAFR